MPAYALLFATLGMAPLAYCLYAAAADLAAWRDHPRTTGAAE